MGTYKVTAGQNIYDVAMHLYGSIEGLADLFINNPALSLADDLKNGDRLVFTDGFTVDSNVMAYNRMHGLVPANGERNVYPKEAAGGHLMEIELENRLTSASFQAQGTGTLEIDWGDNTPVEVVSLAPATGEILHYFNNTVPSSRLVRFYGDVLFRELDLSGFHASAVYLLKPVAIERFTCRKAALNLSFLALATRLYRLSLPGLAASDLSPLVRLQELMHLDLRGTGIKTPAIDAYLKALARQHGGRRSCTVCLNASPSGSYREPEKDGDGNYALRTGMEAVWLLTHEPAWNEGGNWTFIINENTYAYEQDNQGNL